MSGTPGAAAFAALATMAAVATMAALAAAAPAVAAQSPDDFLFGFSDGSPIFGYEGAPTAAGLAALESEAGAEAGRFTVRWEDVQPQQPPEVGPPRYDWSAVDALVGAQREENVAPLPMLLGAPGWAREQGCSGICPPSEEHLADWRAFVAAAAARYGEGAAAIEIWNEPNLKPYWEGGPDPAAYARLFGAAESEIERVRPRLVRLIGGLALAKQDAIDAGSMPIGEWLDGFYSEARAGAARLGPRTALALHVYPGTNELTGFVPGGRVALAFGETRQAIAAGDPSPGRRIWVTETGVSITAPGPGPGGLVTPELQQQGVLAMLAFLQDQEDVDAGLIYTLVDRPPASESDPGSEAGYGLVGRGPAFAPKPAYCAVAGRYGSSPPEACTTG